MPGIFGLEVPGETAHDRQPFRPPGRMGVGRPLRPVEGEAEGDEPRVVSLEVADEVRQQRGRALELEAQGAADLEILVDGVAQGAHATPPGQGCASSRNATRSTLA